MLAMSEQIQLWLGQESGSTLFSSSFSFHHQPGSESPGRFESRQLARFSSLTRVVELTSVAEPSFLAPALEFPPVDSMTDT